MLRILFPVPADCEAAFYDAFERADLNLMMAVWADELSIVCIHPQGPRLAGPAAIRDSFTDIFSHGPNTQLQVSELRQQLGQTLAIHNVCLCRQCQALPFASLVALPTMRLTRETDSPKAFAMSVMLCCPSLTASHMPASRPLLCFT